VQKELEVRRQLVDYESPVGMGPVPFPVPSNNFRREYHSCDKILLQRVFLPLALCHYFFLVWIH
jgi:hypothetical protein